MSPPDRKRIAVLGAGPIGLEAALYGCDLGHDVRVYERGQIGDHILQWGHVTFFSPWALNRSTLGLAELAALGREAAAADSFPTGREYVDSYLRPLAGSSRLAGRIEERCKVVGIARAGIRKGELIGGARDRHQFRLLLETPDGERKDSADVVIDCTGVYGTPNWAGDGNIPAIGERRLRDQIDYGIPDVRGTARGQFSGRRVLLVGSGHSAATALDALMSLENTSVVWVVRHETPPPIAIVPNDPLPERARLSRRANQLASSSDGRVEVRAGLSVERLELDTGAWKVRLRRASGATENLQVDRVVANVGYGPDRSLYAELQVHECYASMGPYALAATLLGADSADCLAQVSPGAETLRNPEPDFFVLGAKSFGRNPNFLIRIGLNQVRDVYTLIEGRPELDLYAA